MICFVRIQINKTVVPTLVDIGSLHNLLRALLVEELWLKVTMTNKILKLVSSKAKITT